MGAAEWQESLAKKENETTALNRQVEWLAQQLRLVRGQRFGMSSERTQAVLGAMEQISLFNETESLEKRGSPEPELEQVTYKRRKQRGKREMNFSGLPVEQVVHELPEDERICVECGNPLHVCGHQVLRRELAYVPAQYKVVEHTLAGIGASLGLSMNFETVTARYVDVRLERKKEVLDACHDAAGKADAPKAKEAEPKKPKSAAKKKGNDLEL